jgi:hypothetical protein
MQVMSSHERWLQMSSTGPSLGGVPCTFSVMPMISSMRFDHACTRALRSARDSLGKAKRIVHQPASACPTACSRRQQAFSEWTICGVSGCRCC